MLEAPNHINHVGLIIDESWSMGRYRESVIKVADGRIERLRRRAAELNQETRVSIYTFHDTVQRPVFEMAVQRVPSLAGQYHPDGRTALIDATLRCITDLKRVADLHGDQDDHAYVIIALTDGEENASRHRSTELRAELRDLPDNWTVAVLVPDLDGRHEAQGFGFPADNIAVWDPATAAGIEEAGATIDEGLETFMTGRARGVRGTRSLFATGIDRVNSVTVRASLTPLPAGSYRVLPVATDSTIRPFVESHGLRYVRGSAYYQWSKTETIQPNKRVVVRDKDTGQVFGGPEARDLVGLGKVHERGMPVDNPRFDVFVQSSSVNRILLAGTDLLILN